jgi:hypothetical protein
LPRSAAQLAVVEHFASGADNRDLQAAGGFEFSEEFILKIGDLRAEGGHVDQVVPFQRIGLEVVEALFVP